MTALFTHMTQKYLQDKHLIPKENLVEVRYETFIEEPLRTVADLYRQFNLEGYQEVEPSLQSYLVTQKTIHQDRYEFSDTIKKRIENHWGFALKEYRYEDPQEETGLKKTSS